jgi:predicted dehydrogenase
VTTRTRIGLVGFGFGGRTFHAPLISSAEGVEFAGVVTRSAERRALVEQAYPGLPVFDDLPALAASGAQAVAVSTPVATHMGLVHEAIRLGLAVVCDKPFALDAESAVIAVREAQAAKILLTVYQNRRWDSDFLTIKRLIAQGALGDVVRFESRFERFRPGTRKRPGVAGGGLLRDFGAHLVDQAIHLFGPVADVYAEADLPADPADLSVLEDRFFLALRHANGVRSHIGGDWVQAAPGPRFRVNGTKAAYVAPALMDGQEAALIAGHTPATEKDGWGVEDQMNWGWLQQGPIQTQVRSERGRWDSFYPAFGAAIRGEGPLPVDPWDSVNAAKVLDAARASATTRRVVTL